MTLSWYWSLKIWLIVSVTIDKIEIATSNNANSSIFTEKWS